MSVACLRAASRPPALPLLALLLAAAPAPCRALAAQERPTRARPAADSSARDSAARAAARPVARVVVTGARSVEAAGGTAALVLRPDSLALPAAARLDEALRETPLVLVRQNSRGEMELSVRGSDSRQAAVFVDGVPLTLGWDHRADPSLVPITGVESLTLVRGLSSLLFGPNTLGGVLDLRVGRGGAAGTAAPPARQLQLASSVDQTGARALSVGGAVPLRADSAGTLLLRAGAGYRAREGFRVTAAAGDRTAEDRLRTNSDLQSLDGFASLRWQRAAGAFLGLTLTGYDAERGVPPELHVAEPRLWRYPRQSRALAALSAGSGRLTTPLGAATLEASAGWNTGRTEIASFSTRAYDTLAGRERGDERTATARLLATHTLPAGGELRAAVTGVEVRYDETLDADPASRYRQRLVSAGSEVQFPVAGRASVGAGLVYDAATTPETGGRPALGRLDAWGWRLGASTLAVGDALLLHASASRRARFPALRELYSGALARFEPNPTLRPETLTALEAGVTTARVGALGAAGLSLQVVGFHHRLTDAVVRTTVPDTRRFRRVNRDEIRSTGAELLAGWTAVPGPRPVTLTGELLVQRVRLLDPSDDLATRRAEHQPSVRGALELGAPLPLALRGTAGVRYTGRQYCVHPDLDAQIALAGQTQGELGLAREWALGGAGPFRLLRGLLTLDNVANATVYDQCGLPQPGRTLRAGVQLR